MGVGLESKDPRWFSTHCIEPPLLPELDDAMLSDDTVE